MPLRFTTRPACGTRQRTAEPPLPASPCGRCAERVKLQSRVDGILHRHAFAKAIPQPEMEQKQVAADYVRAQGVAAQQHEPTVITMRSKALHAMKVGAPVPACRPCLYLLRTRANPALSQPPATPIPPACLHQYGCNNVAPHPCPRWPLACTAGLISRLRT